MNINFFDPACQTTTSEVEFGLCDDPPPPSKPAYIDTDDRTKWIAIIENADKKEVTFTAIDNCIDIRRPDGSMDSRCDGMLTYEDKIIFVELKESKNKNKEWLRKGEEQLKNIISIFDSNNDLNLYKSKTAYIANSLKPNFGDNQMVRMERFKDETGFILGITNIINI